MWEHFGICETLYLCLTASRLVETLEKILPSAGFCSSIDLQYPEINMRICNKTSSKLTPFH